MNNKYNIIVSKKDLINIITKAVKESYQDPETELFGYGLAEIIIEKFGKNK